MARDWNKMHLLSKMSKWLYPSLNGFMIGAALLICATLLLTPFITGEGFIEPYTPAKWISILSSLLCLFFILLYSSHHILLPSLPKAGLYGIAGLLIILVFNSFSHKVPLFTHENIRRIIFWLGVWGFFSFFLKTGEHFVPLIHKTISAALGIFIVLTLTDYAIDPSSPPLLTFGNQNLAAEAVLLFLAFPLTRLPQKGKEKSASLPLTLLIAGSIAYLYTTCCRSVLIELFLILLLLLWMNKASFKEVCKILALSILILLTLSFLPSLGTQLTSLSSSPCPQDISTVILSKDSSFRWLLYLDSLRLILDNPLGVGLGQFEFASLPYLANLFPAHNESIIFLTPHNEFLHFLAEEGIIAFLLSVTLCLYFLSFFRKDLKRILQTHPEFALVTIVFGGEALFQFPLIEPIPYFIAAMMLGRLLALLTPVPLVYSPSCLFKGALTGFGGVLFLFVGLYYAAEYVAISYPEHESLNKRACSALTRNWIACLNMASLSLEKGDLLNAERYASQTLQWQPFNYQGLSLLGSISLEQGKKEKACSLFQLYDSFFQNKSSLHETIVKECLPCPKAIQPRITLKTP